MKSVWLTIENTRTTPMLVWVEPEAMDYWLQPGEKCEVVAAKEGEEAYFELQQTDEGLTIFPSRECGGICVFQSGLELTCGHQRPEDWR